MSFARLFFKKSLVFVKYTGTEIQPNENKLFNLVQGLPPSQGEGRGGVHSAWRMLNINLRAFFHSESARKIFLNKRK